MCLKLIGKRIQQQRKAKQMTQQALAEKIGVSANYLSAVERGINQLAYDKLIDLINCLECSADDIFVDVLKSGYKIKASKLSDQLEDLSMEDQERIFKVVEVMIRDANKK